MSHLREESVSDFTAAFVASLLQSPADLAAAGSQQEFNLNVLNLSHTAHNGQCHSPAQTQRMLSPGQVVQAQTQTVNNSREQTTTTEPINAPRQREEIRRLTEKISVKAKDKLD